MGLMLWCMRTIGCWSLGSSGSTKRAAAGSGKGASWKPRTTAKDMFLTPCPCQETHHTFSDTAADALQAAEACEHDDSKEGGGCLQKPYTLEAQRTPSNGGLIAISFDPNESCTYVMD